VLYYYKDRLIVEQNKELRNNCAHIQPNCYLTREPRVFNGGKSLFNKRCQENWINTCRKMKLDSYLIPLTKINLKWIKDLNVVSETIKLLQENKGGKLLDIGLGSNFLDMIPKAQATKAKISGTTSN